MKSFNMDAIYQLRLDYILDKYQLRGLNSPITMMCSRLVTLPRIFKNLGFILGAEIGVERGRYSQILCSRVPNLKLYGVDAWQTYDGYRDHVPQDRLDSFFLETKKRMKNFNCQLIKDFSVRAARRFEDGSLDFVYIDAAHDYESIKEDIKAWDPKVKRGGIVSGHDYIGNIHHKDMKGNLISYGVIQAVDEWVEVNNISPLFILRKEKSPSWLYVKT